MKPLSYMIALPVDGTDEPQMVAVDRIAAVVPITRRNGAGITFTDGSEIHLDAGGVLRTTEKPRKVLAQMAAALLAEATEAPR